MVLKGKSVSASIAVDKVLIYAPFTCDRSIRKYESEDAEEMLELYQDTKKRAEAELDALGKLLAQKDDGHVDFVQAHKDILLDPVMDQEIMTSIKNEKLYPDSAMIKVYDSYIDLFSKNKNEVIRERAADLRDVLSRLLRCWHKKPERNLARLEEPCIVVSDELLPSDTLSLDVDRIKGIVTEKGGLTSHTAIIARSLGIPAVLGVQGILSKAKDGEILILDGVSESVILEPSQEELESYSIKMAELEKKQEITRQYLAKEAVTKDGTRIALRVNLASAEIHGKERIQYIDGVGLFRSEFLYLSADKLPSEEAQYQAYRSVAQAFGGKAVVLRTLDIGGDKQVSYMQLPQEENPFLGNRGIRLCLTHKDIFRTQIRAALRASAHGNLKLMFPMITSLNEFREAKELVMEVGKELDEEKIEWNKNIQLGVMIETPSIAVIADRIVDEVDFASVGTNDLTQYLCAADRMNSDVREYYQDYHPAVFSVLASLAETFQKAGKTLSICGELAGDPKAVPVLVGIGIRALSQSITGVALSKQIIRSIDISQAQELAKDVLAMKTDKEIEKRLTDFLDGLGLE